ncbi:MAG: NfeD family protein [Actinomycetota bacterium]|nr:NfeD family protein [Actinomycetota bacterium]
MDSWLLWLIVAVILGVGEMFTVTFYLVAFAGGALLAGGVAAAGGDPLLQGGVFLVSSAALLTALRPLARKRMPPQLRTGTAALTGRPATVVERIANHEGVGAVKLEGEIWTARSYLEDEVYEAGTRVEVVEIRGATALVMQ